MSCRQTAHRPPWLPCLAAAMAALGATMALAQPVQPNRPVAPAASPAPIATAASDLLAGARQWVGERHQLAPASVNIHALDPRMQVRPCSAGWQFDRPFPNNEAMLRARCASPAWQVFLQVALPAQAAAVPPAAAGSSREAAPTRTVVTTTTLLPRGTRLQPEHLTLAEVPAQGLALQGLERLEDATGAEIVRDLPAGTPLRNADLRPAWMVRKGQLVLMSWSPVPGLRIAARLEAMEDGRLGETVRLKNRDSGRVVSAQVSGPNAAQGL